MIKYLCADCGVQLTEGTARCFTVCDKCWDAHVAARRDTQVGGNHDERGLRGDPGADRTAGDDTRDQEIARLKAALFTSERFRASDAASHIDDLLLVVERAKAAEADRDHARAERDKAQAERDAWQVRHLSETLAREDAQADLLSAREELATLKGTTPDWICEAHPEHAWPHEGCGGAGQPRSTQIDALAWQREHAQAELATLKWEVENAHAGRQAEQLRREAAEQTDSRLQPYVQHREPCPFAPGYLRLVDSTCTCGLVPR